jgi:hypothetical protein
MIEQQLPFGLASGLSPPDLRSYVIIVIVGINVLMSEVMIEHFPFGLASGLFSNLVPSQIFTLLRTMICCNSISRT